MPRIVRIITRLNVGGPARHAGWLDASLRQQGVDETLVVGRVPSGESDMTEFVESLGVRPITLEEMSRELSFRDVLAIWKLYWLFRDKRPDLIHTHTAKAGTVGRLAGWFYKWFTLKTLVGLPRRCQFVHTFHGHIFHGYYGSLKTWVFLTIERILAKVVTDRIVVISPRQFEEIHRDFRIGRADQFCVIRLGLDLSPYEQWREKRELLREEISADSDEVLVGIVGRITEIKNHALFLQAAAQLVQRTNQKVRFLVIGDGPLREELERQANAIDANIQFLGMRSDPEVFYPGLDVVALTSKNEGTPLTLIEAMANARPVVSTLVGGVVDILGAKAASQPNNLNSCSLFQHGVGVELQTADSVAEGLRLLVEDAELRDRLGLEGQKFVREHYRQERLVHDVVELYNELLPSELQIAET